MARKIIIALTLALALTIARLAWSYGDYTTQPITNSYEADVYIQRDVTQPWQDYKLITTQELTAKERQTLK